MNKMTLLAFLLAMLVGIAVGDILYFKLYKKESWKGVLERGAIKIILFAIIGYLMFKRGLLL